MEVFLGLATIIGEALLPKIINLDSLWFNA